jgi:methionyl-tRNA formyltransferase
MKVVLVTHDSAFSRYVAATLYEASAVDHVLVETTGPAWRFYWRKLRRVGIIDFVFQAWLARWYRREGARALPSLMMPPHERIESANDYSFDAADLAIGFGTSYITAATLSRMPNGFLNLHTGYLPHYRGVKSEFWTLARHDLAHVGWTLHYMSTAIDAGDIVVRRRVPWEGESPAALRAKLLRDAAPTLATLLRDVRAHGAGFLPRAAQGSGEYFTTPRWSEWRRYRQSAAPAPATPVPSE